MVSCVQEWYGELRYDVAGKASLGEVRCGKLWYGGLWQARYVKIWQAVFGLGELRQARQGWVRSGLVWGVLAGKVRCGQAGLCGVSRGVFLAW